MSSKCHVLVGGKLKFELRATWPLSPSSFDPLSHSYVMANKRKRLILKKRKTPKILDGRKKKIEVVLVAMLPYQMLMKKVVIEMVNTF